MAIDPRGIPPGIDKSIDADASIRGLRDYGVNCPSDALRVIQQMERMLRNHSPTNRMDVYIQPPEYTLRSLPDVVTATENRPDKRLLLL